MFDLNEQIRRWRRELIEQEVYHKSDIDELECHLRDEIANLAEGRLTVEEKYQVALGRLGTPKALVNEFAKINGSAVWGNRLFWMATSLLMYFVLKAFIAAVSKGFTFLAVLGGIRGYDLGYLRMLPNLIVAAPADENELKGMLALAAAGDKPFAIRYPKDSVPVIPQNDVPVEFGKSACLRKGDSEFAVVTIGPIVIEALAAAQMLEKEGISISVVNARFAKPVDEAIIELFARGKTVLLIALVSKE